jgi:hypothetical protein
MSGSAGRLMPRPPILFFWQKKVYFIYIRGSAAAVPTAREMPRLSYVLQKTKLAFYNKKILFITARVMPRLSHIM